MPRVLKYTPGWLSRPSPGFNIFTSSQSAKLSEHRPAPADGPRRTIAQRGTEIFVAVGNELRWSDLVLLRDDWEEGQAANNSHGSDQAFAYRVLKVPVSRTITQLIVSPSGDYLAILTSHTIHVAILPDPSHLTAEDTSPIRLKTYHIGPTSHVLERSPIASALWHPHGVAGNCLVTITVDATVRLWELDRNNKWSFDSPALAVDLKKLANATTGAEDFSPSKYGTSKGFSPDSFEMEVASACFGGSEGAVEDLWASMTLWVAMREGDIYALCPLVPNKWEISASRLQNLAASVACLFSSAGEGGAMSKRAQQTAVSQTTWVSDLMSQEALTDRASTDLESVTIVLRRPVRPGSIPMLQGPLHITPDGDEMFDITDIRAVLSSGDERAASEEDFDTALDEHHTSVQFLCIATADGKVHVCIDVEGMEGRWLPTKNAKTTSDEDTVGPELLLIESLTVSDSGMSCWPMFSADPQSQDALFVTHDLGVSHVDLASWSKKVAAELNGDAESGLHFRMGLLMDSSATTLEHPLVVPQRRSAEELRQSDVVTCISILDSDLGFLVLSQVNGQPQCVTLEENLNFDHSLNEETSDGDTEENVQGLITYESRPSYQPPQDLWAESSLSSFINQHVHSHDRRSLRDEVKLSPSTLKLLMEAHRVLSQETHRLGLAASSLFRRCERLQEEFKDQVRQANDAADRIDAVVEGNGDAYEDEEDEEGLVSSADKIEERFERIKSRQETLTKRYADLRLKLNRLNGRPITEKESAWMGEIQVMDDMLGGGEAKRMHEDGYESQQQLSLRVNEVKELGLTLLGARLSEAQRQGGGEHETESAASMNASANRRRALSDIHAMLERQTALVDATRAKLERIGLMTA